MPKAHQRYANTTPASLIRQATGIGANTAILVERMMRDRPHPEQGYRSAFGVLSLARRYERERLEAACERALIINAITYSSVNAILCTDVDGDGHPDIVAGGNEFGFLPQFGRAGPVLGFARFLGGVHAPGRRLIAVRLATLLAGRGQNQSDAAAGANGNFGDGLPIQT